MKRAILLTVAISSMIFSSGAVTLKMAYPEPALMPQEIGSTGPQRWGYYNLTDEGKFYLQIGYQFENAWAFNRNVGMAQVIQDGKIGFIEKTGAFVIPAIYDWTSGFNDYDVCVVSVDGNVGVIDVNGNEVIPIKYSGVEDMLNGWFEIWENGEPANLWISITGRRAQSYQEYQRMREEEQ
ncbi:MAG: WG repeat-containing protein [Bacteroidales bacterium]|nr:WG repeat-containing protein [Bacteroidales bacterium]